MKLLASSKMSIVTYYPNVNGNIIKDLNHWKKKAIEDAILKEQSRQVGGTRSFLKNLQKTLILKIFF